MDKKILGTINVTDEKFMDVANSIAREFFPENLYFTLGMYAATVCATLIDKDSTDDEDMDSLPDVHTDRYIVGNWTIKIITSSSTPKAYLEMYYDDEKRISRFLPTLHKAYNYAFNILIG